MKFRKNPQFAKGQIYQVNSESYRRTVCLVCPYFNPIYKELVGWRIKEDYRYPNGFTNDDSDTGWLMLETLRKSKYIGKIYV